MFLTTHSYATAASLSLLILLIVSIRLSHNRQILNIRPLYSRQHKYRLYFQSRICFFMNQHVQMLMFNESVNRYYSPALVLFLANSFPMNAFLLLNSIYAEFNIFDMCIVGCLMMSQVFGCCVLHFIASKLTYKFHLPIKQIIHLYVFSKNLNRFACKIRFRMRMAWFIGAFHTENQYGPTYGKWYGLITMKAFVQVNVFMSEI